MNSLRPLCITVIQRFYTRTRLGGLSIPTAFAKIPSNSSWTLAE